MTSSTTSSLEHILRALKQSPLFHLSLASKELFHSNFLAWLCETYPRHSGRLFATFLPHVPSSHDRLRVYRERNNIDVTLEYPGGEELIIENKVKSLPSQQQLEEYATTARHKAQTGFLLLSLTRPAFLPLHETTIRLNDGVVWQYLTYREYADMLRDILPGISAANNYHGQLLCDYIDFITQLDALQSHFVIDWDGEHGNFFGVQNDLQRLASIRLHDLIDKMRYAQLAQRVSDALRKEGFALIHKDLWHGQPGQVLVDAGMTRGVGLFDLKYFVMNKDHFGNPVILGVQVQGNDFRLVVEVWDRSRAPKIAMALWQPDDANKLWFDFGLLPNGSDEYPKKRAFNQYSGQFLYRSKRLRSIAPQHLVDIIVVYAHLIQANESAICQQIETAL
jgi:PD-(D/E)XK nuclease superfamily